MRTPGADRELTAGFLFSERVLKSADALGTIEHCRDAKSANVVDVTLAGGAVVEFGFGKHFVDETDAQRAQLLPDLVWETNRVVHWRMLSPSGDIVNVSLYDDFNIVQML